MDKYILKYLFEQTSDKDVRRMYDYLKSDIDFRLWSQGRHFAQSWDVVRASDVASQNRPKWRKVLGNLKSYIKGGYRKQRSISKKTLVLPQSGYNVLSVVDMPVPSQKRLQECGINYFYVGINHCYIEYDMPAMEAMVDFFIEMQRLTFRQLIADETIKRLHILCDNLKEELSRYAFDAVLVRTSESFFEKILIDIFQAQNKPSITLLHGLPGIYTKATESRADYLLVWGDRIREAFIASGYNKERVLVAGNFKYTEMPVINGMRCAKEDILVLTTETWADGQHEWEYEKFPIHDRSLLITYLYSVEHTLKMNGVNHARLRPHPHVSRIWLRDYIDMNFYTFDEENILTSLKHTTMCIGPTSTTIMEALMSGVSYLVYEPGDGMQSMMNELLVPPFDKNYIYLKKARTEEELSELIQTQYKPDANQLLQDFLQPFNPQIIKQILDGQKV